VVGAVLGYLVMLDRDVATNPYGLMAICCSLTFLCGFLALSGLKYAIFLLLIT
jgi:F0F1-type ATP synthase assembly protein I